jgi:hypothetical protein
VTTTARQIITGALTLSINRLSPGEAIDADLAATSLAALNFIVDEMNGSKAILFREILTTSGPITGASAVLGVDWAGLKSGDQILGATVRYTAGVDQPIAPITMDQYSAIPIKTVASIPQQYAHDGAARVYLYPMATGQTITSRTLQVVQDFADLDTNYEMPRGYMASFAALLAERLAPTMLGGITADIAKAARSARNRIGGQAASPAIIGAVSSGGRLGSFLAGR